MKVRFISITVCSLLLQTTFAQSILPAAKSFKIENGKYISELKRNKENDTTALKNILAMNLDSRFTTMNLSSDARNKKITGLSDSLYKAYQDSVDRLELIQIVKKLNESNSFTPVVTAGVSNLENSKQTYGSLSFGLQFRLSKYKLTKNNWIDPHFLYLIFSAKTASSPDSSSIQKTFMFPELNKRDFVIGYFWQFQKNDWTIAPTFEFSLNRFADTSNKKNFVSQSLTAGVRFQKSLNFQNLKSFVSLYPYYSLITVDKKYSEDYEDLIKETKIPSTFHSFGLHVSAQFPNAILFCNMKYILNKEGELKSRDLKRFIYTIGTLLSL
jgi:hypothetical protein